MAGSSKSIQPKPRKRVEVETGSGSGNSLVRGKDGSAFARCEECNKDVPVALISFHNCSLDAKIKMNLEAQVIENPAEVKKPTERKKPRLTEPKAKKAKKENGKSGKKRPPTAFFVFLSDFRKTYKEANPDSKLVKEVAKQGGEKWKSMSDEEKKPYLDKAAELKAEYEKALESNSGDENENENGSKNDEEGSDKEVAEVQEVSDEE
ncbi:high mobility group B protein 7-like [Tripterygium wilfordii]|uniref:High mobility group B protein 7-like n=1 Tax=Tripterygium wilfordii TaxID=458696 RepID=A0A7J7DU69_TRIWF|nr:high mobility group B protein 7-like [Tripterygium wilfordii]KAF5749841.1 high mobility group B protein 7-like [Tripterygium wilfordii]